MDNIDAAGSGTGGVVAFKAGEDTLYGYSVISPDALAEVWRAVRRDHPLVLCITNRVTPQRVADTLLAAGASPVMADNPREIPQMAAIANAVYINTGVHETQLASLETVAAVAQQVDKPFVLDPVGAGATEYRTGQILRTLGAIPFRAVRGNASEIRALAGESPTTRGVDSTDTSDSALEAALLVSRERGCAVAVSGERDLVVSDGRVVRVGGGHPWLTMITGSGCALSALCTACISCTDDAMAGMVTAHAAFSVAAGWAASRSQGPGTLSVHLLDELAALKPEDFHQAEIETVRMETPGSTSDV